MARTKIYLSVISIIIFILTGFIFAPIQAANLQDAFGVSNNSNEDNLDKVASTAKYDTNNAETQLEDKIARVIGFFFSFLGVIFVLLMIYGGYLWMTDRGNEDQVKKAKDLIESAVIGLVIIAAAYAISAFVMLKFGIAFLK